MHTKDGGVSYAEALYQGERVILIRFAYDTALIKKVKKIRGIGWSPDLKAWYIPDSDEYGGMLEAYFPDFKNVLSKEEVKARLEVHGNIIHRAMLSLIYACGLRRGELLHMKISDIDSKRNIATIRQSKGKKDRIVPLSQKILEMLRDYFRACNKSKAHLMIFENSDPLGEE